MRNRKYLSLGIGMLVSFSLWTMLVRWVDVQAIGPQQSAVGFATINGFFHKLTGVHMTLYHITDWMGLVPVGFGLGFAILGLVQWIKRKHIRKVDSSILILGGFYITVAAAYLLFEEVVINYRPTLINGYLEASYPSSTTLLVLCVMPTAIFELRRRIKTTCIKNAISLAISIFIMFMVIGRLISGVHWLTDIVGGILLSAGFVLLYYYFIGRIMMNQDYNIRLEKEEEHREVENLIRESFWNVYRPGCLEHYVIHQLRNDPAFIPQLNFVMEKDGKIIGQNMFMHAVIQADDGRQIPIVTMGPICITNELKRHGYGKKLLDYSLEKATEMGFGAICFEGNIRFYGKSGLTYGREFGLRYHDLPEGANDSFFLCKELKPGYLQGITGVYAPPQGYFVDADEAEEFDKSFPPKEKLKLPGQLA